MFLGAIFAKSKHVQQFSGAPISKLHKKLSY